jgi:phosphomannomutase
MTSTFTAKAPTMAGRTLDPSILREYDIRGIVGKTLGPDDARSIGHAFGTLVRRKGGKRVQLGRDGRLSSAVLEDAVAEGLMAAGCDVYRIGEGPTPMLYYSVHERNADGGIQITGSHNPPEYNGFKLMLGKKAFFGEDIFGLGRLAASGDFERGSGAGHDDPVFDSYIARLARDFETGGRPLTVAWDSGNGAAGPAMAALTGKLPGRHVLLNVEIDGTFPNHHPDPTVPKNLEQLQACVAKEKCDLGIAFDGDGDRIGVVDGKGRILWGDQLMAVLARGVLAALPGATIIADVKASQILFDEIARLGGKPLMWKTGHSLVKAKMAETGAPLAGEMSGHIFFAHRYYGFDDALYAAIRLLSILAHAKESLADMRDALPSVINTPELRFQCDDDRKFKVVEEVKARLAAAGAEVNDVDGVRVKNADGWWLLRASNTQDVLVARAESTTSGGLARLKAAIADAVTKSGVAPPDFDAAQGGH